MVTFRHPLLRGMALWLLATSPAVADEALLEEATQAQRAQAEWQTRIDAADDEARERLQALRELEAEARRLEARNTELEPQLERREEALARRQAALDSLANTRAALPSLTEGLETRLAQWVEHDLPFLLEERRARVASLEDPALSEAERLERLLAAWRAELDYGRELDTWRGYLTRDETRREVDYLRLGRIGLYYLTPDGRGGGVWLADEHRWRALDDDERSEVRKGVRIARDQRAPELLELPVSQSLTPTEDQEERS